MTVIDSKTPIERKPVSLALQGGGSWGAYTWGVLDGLLARRSIAIERVSGTSAGAINAAIVASALARGDEALARNRLRAFWNGVSQPAVSDLTHALWGPVERRWRETISLWLPPALTPGGVSPALNPLRDLIGAYVDFDALRSEEAIPLFVTVTNVRTGRPRVISNAEMSLDVLLASACLPQLFQAVEIDGEPYWDGGYSGNPALWPMIDGEQGRDVILVQLTPAGPASVPSDHMSIQRRIHEIVFNASLVAEMRSIAGMRAVGGAGRVATRVRELRLHRVGPPPARLLADGSPLERSSAWIERLQGAGRRAVQRFLTRHHGDLGVRETLDIGTMFGPRSGLESANDDPYAQAAAL